MKKKMIFIVAFTLLICNLTACQGTPGTTQRSSDPALKTQAGNSTPKESETPDPVVEFSEEDEQELYNLYVDINNYMVGRLYDSIERYFKYVAFEEEFSLIGNNYSDLLPPLPQTAAASHPDTCTSTLKTDRNKTV